MFLVRRTTPREQTISIVSILLLDLLELRTNNCLDKANSILFTKEQRNAVIISNIGILSMIFGVYYACRVFGVPSVIKYYGIPWLCVTHWCKFRILDCVQQILI